MKERLIEFLAYLKIGQNAFEKKAGLSLGFINKCSGNMEMKTLDKIEAAYPELNMDWLKYGKGSMLKKGVSEKEFSVNETGHGVPYYDVDFELGFELMENDQTANPTYYIDFHKYNKADFWVNATGNSMSPLINHGDTVALQRIEDWAGRILFGEIYAVVTEDFRTIKKIRKSRLGSEYLLFVPENTENYDEQDVAVAKIDKVFRVLGCAKIM